MLALDGNPGNMTTTAVAQVDMSIDESRLSESRRYCREVARRRARNFYYGMKLVPEPKRSAMDALYAWMRMADDLADEAGDGEGKKVAIDGFLSDTKRAISPASGGDEMPEGEMWPAVREMAIRYELPFEYLEEMIAGQLMDQEKTRYATFEELYDYCYKVASVVGLSCIQIWGYDGGEETRKLAEWRGIAFQLTNILRDVIEDANRDRVYLPADQFDAVAVNPVMFKMGDGTDALRGVKKVIELAEDYYGKSEVLDRRVHRDGRACLWAMTAIYRGLLDKISGNPAVVLSGERVRLSRMRKGWIAFRSIIGSKLPGV